MKISKLFHWLYAILMLLPAFAIGVTCAYAIFNKNAYQSYYGDTINEKQYLSINEGESFSDNIDYRLIVQGSNGETFTGSIYYLKNVQINSLSNDSYRQYFTEEISLRFYYDTENKFRVINSNNQTAYIAASTFRFDITFNFANNTQSYTTNLKDYLYEVEYNSYSYVSEVFYYSIDKVQQSPLFNWAYDSFLAQPITYITRLFGIADNNIAILLMSYWLDISIIYLVFDMVMYVPLLVHRWLDKGVLE